MMASLPTFNKHLGQAGCVEGSVAGSVTSIGTPSESHSEVSSAGGDWSDMRAIALQLGVENPDDLFTERFKVDRQKLENMIRVDSCMDGNNNALNFFESVMKQTETYITWPCRLKIGAKTRKDPHVRIVGRPDNVNLAKERVLAALNPKGTRVIMKMDVSYTDHSYIIGRGGNNIKHIMEETATHIHFPDSNRSNPTEKSNQVSLCGSLEGVEKARAKVRLSTPLLISFELPIAAPERQIPDNHTPYVKDVELKYNVQVIFSTRPKLYSSLVLVKGAEMEAVKVQEATQLLIKYMCDSIANETYVHMQLEISPQHHDIVRGPDNTQLLSIMERTKTKIIFPDVNDMNTKPIKKSQVIITGTIDGVYLARQQLIGSIPITLIFDYPDNTVDTSKIISLSNKHGVYITVRQKSRQSSLCIVVKGVEKFVDKVYEAQHELLNMTTPLIRPEIPTVYFSPTDFDQEHIYRKNLAMLLANYPESPITPIMPGTPTQFNYNTLALQKMHISPNNNLTPTTARLPTNHILAPMAPGGGAHMPTITARQMQQHQQQIQRNSMRSASFRGTSTNANCNIIGAGSAGGGGAGAGGGVGSTGNYLTVPHLSPRNTSNNTSGYQSFSSSTTSLEQCYQPYNNVSSSNYSPEHSGNYSGGGAAAASASNMTHANRCHSDSGNTHSLDFNYGSPAFDMKRVEGYKAMDRAPHGEVRTPTNHWTGLGLSKTSPLPSTTEITWPQTQTDAPPGYVNMAATSGLMDVSPAQRRLELLQHKDIYSMLTYMGLEHYIKTFVCNEIDLDIFSTLTEDNLIDLGITAFGPRRKMVMAIKVLKTNAGNSPSSGLARFSGSAAPGAERRTTIPW